MLKKLQIPNLSSSITIKILFLFMSLLISSAIFAHGDLSDRIVAKTQEISENPKNYELYYERGFLFQQHEEYDKSLKDYSKSRSLGNSDKILYYRIAEIHQLTEDYNIALKNIEDYLKIDNIDVKAKKLQAEILFKLEKYNDAISAYKYVLNTMTDIRPDDILVYCDIILAENNQNYTDALNAIDFGLGKLGANTLSLQLKKLDYLKDSNQVEKALEQYNYFILEFNRKEFWYYKKAVYLLDINKPQEATISLKLATISIEQLDSRFKNMPSILKLKRQIENLEHEINSQKS